MFSGDAQIPTGRSSTLRGISDNFSFHASPEAFITEQYFALHKENPQLSGSATAATPVVRAKILNRNVAIVSDYRQIRHVLGDDYTEGGSSGQEDAAFVASAAYEELMAPFFPAPNLLLTDPGPVHERMRIRWDGLMGRATGSSQEFINRTTREHFLASIGRCIQGEEQLDLYTCMKSLSWKLLLGVFLQLQPKEVAYGQVEDLHELLLRGQLSLVPVSISAWGWRSPRKKAIDASASLMDLILKRLRLASLSNSSGTSSCPFMHSSHAIPPSGSNVPPPNEDELAAHLRLFTSSLAVKSLASLLTAFFLNLFLFQGPVSDSTVAAANNLAGQIRVMRNNEAEQYDYLRSVLAETERLSPPIVGVMRQSTCQSIIPSSLSSSASSSSHSTLPSVLIPKGWDVWLYFVSGNRDCSFFGPSALRFQPDRYCRNPNQPENTATTNNTDKSELNPPPALGLAFGSGSKRCVGSEFIRDLVVEVAKTCINDLDLNMIGKVGAKGVRAWLGWELGNDHEADETVHWAKDMKQLPTQRPAKPIMVHFTIGADIPQKE